MSALDRQLRRIDRIPWPIIGLAGIIGFLTLLRYLHIQIRGRR